MTEWDFFMFKICHAGSVCISLSTQFVTLQASQKSSTRPERQRTDVVIARIITNRKH